MQVAKLWFHVLVALAALFASGCRGGGEGPDARDTPAEAESERERAGPPHANWEVLDTMRDDLAKPRHPSDGGGRAWLEQEPGEPPYVVAGTLRRFTIVYEVGPLGIASGGAIHLQVSPFWDWSTPQVEDPRAPGYTLVEPSADDIELEMETLDVQLLGLVVTGRPLVAGERIRIIYGAGEVGAFVDSFAERGSRFWIAVDGDGDGVRAFLADSPGVDVVAGDPAQLFVTLPSIARPGETVDVKVAVLDASGNTGVAFEGDIALEATQGLELPARVSLELADRGRKTLQAVVRGSGVLHVRAEGPGELSAESNPLLVSAEGPRVLWGDLHGHTAFSDGTGTPEDYYLYARDVAALDVVALTDHDHWGVLPLSSHPEMWAEIREQTRRFHEPGRFVTLLGYEWTSWIHGHRHVLYFADEGEVFSWLDPDYESPIQLWKALEGRPALTFAHHSAGGPIPVNWEIAPDPHFEPVTEIASVHGSSEALDSPLVIYSAVPGNFVRDVLDRGYRFGLIGSGDSHDGHPGLPQLNAPSGGLAAIFAEERTREDVLAALRARRVYATNGPRILLRCALGAHAMGTSIPVPEGELLTEPLFVRVIAPEPLERLDLVRSGEVVDSVDLEQRRDVTLQRVVADLAPGEYVYLRAVQSNGGTAWSSPFYLE
jgi:hypothetical protein